jgi:isoleucyl-tRNA synthetase
VHLSTEGLEKQKDPLSLPPTTVRDEARVFANQQVDSQKAMFRKLGIMADWDNNKATYRTLGLCFLSLFKLILAKGL